MEFIRKNIKIVFLLVIPVHFFIAQNSILNKHTHFYANGIVVTHSHPVNKKDRHPISDHRHTKTEICFFHSIHFDAFIVPDGISIKKNLYLKPSNYFIFNDRIENVSICGPLSLRGPPVLVS